MLKYEQKSFKDIKKDARVALPVKNKSLYLSTEGTIKEVSTVRLFKVLEINENRSSGTFTAELMELGFTDKNAVQPLIFDPDTEVFEVFDTEDEKKEKSAEKEDKRKVIKG